ncbi:MAG: Na(+)/H(+) antiporter 1 [Methanosaeta sp. PtaU1.Bin060]|nr:MAG: Na(+)/H(+) antiporter 1 [Methanosaeta sp. PtaU1.Bin060]
MNESPLLELAGVIVIGISAQWIAWRIKLPSILLLLIFGFLAGPVMGFLNPDRLFGSLLSPFVALSLALILFEGGMGLKITDVMENRKVVRNLLSIGVITTWIIASASAYLILGLEPLLSILLGSILVVTGPTVVIPLLLHVRPSGKVGPILKWEGIMNDPLGAVLAILVLQGILASAPHEAAMMVAAGIMKTVISGGITGFLGALILIKSIRSYIVPDRLLEIVSLMIVVIVFTTSELIQEESGLLGATLMGIVLANQNSVDIKSISKFKESLRTLLISILFIILSARLPLSYLDYINLDSLFFLGILIFVARPAAVALSTYRSDLSWQEKVFIAFIAPRGIVAAAAASIFGLYLFEKGFPQAELLAPLTFMVVAGTVAIYSLIAAPLAWHLGLASRNPKGFLIVGAHPWARKIASVLKAQGLSVLLVDTNSTNIAEAFEEGFSTYHGSIISESILDEIDISDLGHLLALTSDDMVNSLACIQFREIFGRREVYQIRPDKIGFRGKETIAPLHLHGRFLFSSEVTYSYLDQRFNSGASITINEFTENFKYDPSKPIYDANAIPLMLMSDNGSVYLFAEDEKPVPFAGQKLVSLISPNIQAQDTG